jgi:uncharacterized protein with HEPN domain
MKAALLRAREYASAGREAFLASSLLQDAVIRNLEILGEATKQLPAETTRAEPSIPWDAIAGMRDVLIHHCFGVDLELVWAVVENRLPLLQDALERLLARAQE